MSTNISSLIDFVNTYSLADLRRQGEEWTQILIERKQAITAATDSYNQALAIARLIDSAIRIREAAQPSQNGHGPTSSPSESPSARLSPSASTTASASPSPGVGEDAEIGKTARMLETLQHARLTPAGLYQSLRSEGMAVRRAYVYTVLQRLKKRGQVDSDENGRYFAT